MGNQALNIAGPMATRKRRSRNQVVILVETGFDEVEVAWCVRRFREHGAEVALVSPSAGLIASNHGMKVRPDETIDAYSWSVAPRLVIVPGSSSCAERLATDPRIRRLLSKVVDGHGLVAFMKAAQPIGRLGSGHTSHCLTQGRQELGEFVSYLVDRTFN